MSQPRFPSRQAFTLVELLVSTTIIAVLAALVFAGGNRFLRKGEDVVCANNMRQTAAAILQYANENNGYFPPIQDTDGIKSWANTVVAYLGADPNNEMAKWKATLKYMRCPSHRRFTARITGKTSEDQYIIHELRNFGMNTFLGPSAQLPTNWRTLSSINRPSETMLLTESGLQMSGRCVGILDNYWLGQSTLDTNGHIRPGVHEGANNIAWCDGHVSKWKDVSLLQKHPYRDGGTQDLWRGQR